MKRFFFTVVLLLLTMLLSFASAEERIIVSTDEWTPPHLENLTASDSPELLLLQVAQGEVGYVEGPQSDETKYGDWFCGGRCAWCAEFITWCVDQVDQRYGTDLMDNLFPYYGGPSTGAPFFIEKGRFISDNGKLPTNEKQWLIGSDHYLSANEYVPYPGDYIWFYYYNRTVGTDHVALVEGVSRNSDGGILVHVIEGNNPDRVQRATYELTDQRVYGFGTPVKRANSNLRLYNSNDDVTLLQQKLISLGYYAMEEGQEGYFTKAVQAAVKQFQRDHDMVGSGIVDMDTYNAIEAALSGNGV
ncbi:MAG: peptidoglycan-binding protein [Eubacteriales bacterium]|nr:peptidoglycan-binding protein [Eubacteriales bacterium]